LESATGCALEAILESLERLTHSNWQRVERQFWEIIPSILDLLMMGNLYQPVGYIESVN